MLFGLPLGTIIALGGILALPVATYGLYRIDRARANGYVTVLGYRAPSGETE
jgi:hypothetical protein